ncbi:hypothetical protein H7U19_15395 [Hyunsoonleella sp. SJ7]|uniref:Uncharacterized protein n=1 Tax=Hyunsoonleella aquatilis TaxID=2762758 RepID=A0A923HK66_9FLAO|nr:DUF6090 family protein [Hyunsoonleella aquatilis]MBC3759797.1 hypothetical protein [Hyunsoonleella aquatilis]
MIKFFRRIRQKLLSQNSFRKYLLYAIGEIMLVIIGILLALAVADWNENRLSDQREHAKLRQVKKGLKTDLHFIDSLYTRDVEAIEKASLLDSLLKSPRTKPDAYYNPLFGNIYGMRFVNINSAYYEDLKSFGYDKIKNEALRLQLIQVFERDYLQIRGLLTNEQSINQVNRPYYLKNFNQLAFWDYAVPNNIDQIWNDSYYQNIVNYRLITLRANQGDIYPRSIKNIQILLGMIDEYLNE